MVYSKSTAELSDSKSTAELSDSKSTADLSDSKSWYNSDDSQGRGSSSRAAQGWSAPRHSPAAGAACSGPPDKSSNDLLAAMTLMNLDGLGLGAKGQGKARIKVDRQEWLQARRELRPSRSRSRSRSSENRWEQKIASDPSTEEKSDKN